MKSNLVLKIIMSANDKASKAFERIKNASSGLNGALHKTQKELSETEQAAGKLSKLKKNVAVLEETRQKHRAVTEAIKKMRQEMHGSRQVTAKQKNDYRKLHESAEKLRQKQIGLMKSNRELTDELNRSGLTMSKGAISAKSLAQAESRLQKKNNALTASLEKQRKATERLSKARQALNAAGHIAGTAGITAIAAQNRAAALSRPLIQTAIVGAEFEKDFSRVVALQRLDKNKKEDASKIAAQRQQALDLGATTAYTSGQVAQGQGYLAMAGFSHDQIIKATPHTLGLGTAAGMQDQLGEVANLMSNIMSGFGIAAEQTQRAADVMTATFTNTNTNLTQLGETAAYAAPIMKAAGQSYESTMSMAGLLGNIGIQGSMAGTTLKNLATNLVNPKVIKELKDIGVATTDKNGSMRQIPDILADIGKEINRLPNGKKLAFIENIFGKIPLAGATELIDQLSSGKATELFSKIQNSQGATQTTAKIMADNTSGDWDSMKSAAEALQISLFDKQSGAIRGLLQDVTLYLRSMNEWIKANPELAAGIIKTIAVAGIVLTVIAGLATAVASLIVPIAALRFGWTFLATSFGGGASLIGKAFSLIKGGIWKLLSIGGRLFGVLIRGILLVGRAFLMNPIGLAVTLIVGALYLLWTHWDTVKNALISGWNRIKGIFRDNPLLAAFTGPIGWIIALMANWDKFKAAVAAGWQWLKTTLRDNPLLGFLAGPIGLIATLIANFDRLIAKAKAAWQTLKNFNPGQAAAGAWQGIKSMAGFSSGGYTGAGGINETAGIVHKGEVVFSQRDVARFGGWQAVEKLRRGGLNALQTVRNFGGRMPDALMPSENLPAADGAPVLAGAIPVPAGFNRARNVSYQGGGQNIVINIHGGSQSPQDIAREVARQLEQHARQAARRARSALFDKD